MFRGFYRSTHCLAIFFTVMMTCSIPRWVRTSNDSVGLVATVLFGLDLSSGSTTAALLGDSRGARICLAFTSFGGSIGLGGRSRVGGGVLLGLCSRDNLVDFLLELAEVLTAT